jgi:hypothetical protein
MLFSFYSAKDLANYVVRRGKNRIKNKQGSSKVAPFKHDK